MKTTTIVRKNTTLAAAHALLAGNARDKEGFDYPPFFAKCDTLTLTKEDAVDYLQRAADMYPVLKEDAVTEDVEILATLLPASKSRQQANRAKNAKTASASQRLHLFPGQDTPVAERLIALSGIGNVLKIKEILGDDSPVDIDRLTLHTTTAYDGGLRNVYAGVEFEGKAYRIGGSVSNALAMCSVLPEAKLVFVVTPISDADEA